ncbi:MAG: M56 family metallopeptidase [Roseovarius sp.]
MITGDALINAFIDANILIAVAFVLWKLARAGLRHAGLKHAYGTELQLLNGVFLAILCAPFAVLGLSMLQGSGYATAVNLNLSDMVVSHYLNGGFQMKAAQFEQLLLARDTFTLNVAQAAGWAAWVAIFAFAAGLAMGAVRLGYSMLCLRRIVTDSFAWRRFGRVHICLSNRVLVPFSTRGVRRYYVVIPAHMLGEPSALRVSLAHEFQHLRQGDIEWEILLETLKPLFFLNPFFHAWKRQVETLRELSCDSRVLNRGRIAVGEYADTLLSICQQSLRRDRLFVVAVPKVTLVTADRLGGRGSFLEHRVRSLFDASRLRHPRLILGALMLPLVALVMMTAVAIQHPGDWSQDRLMLSTVVNLERLDEITRASGFGLARN